MNFEAMIKVPVAPLIEKIKHDLSVYDEEQTQIAMAYAMTKVERKEYEMLRYTISELYVEYAYLTGDEEYYYKLRWKYNFSSLLDTLRHVRNPEYLEKIRALLVACENSIDGFVYLHDMGIYDSVGKFVITPNILKVGMDDVERIKNELAVFQAQIDEMRQKITAYHREHCLDALLEDDKPAEPENYNAMLPLLIFIGVILAVIAFLKFTH